MTTFSAEFYGIALFGVTLLLYVASDVMVEAYRKHRNRAK